MTYPAAFDVQTPDRVANWRPLVHWFLAIPHFIVLSVLGIVGFFVVFVSWVVVLFTGALPAGLANLQSLVLRYSMRVTVYVSFLHAEYPPFDFAATSDEPGGTPVLVAFSPELENRNRLTSGLRFIWVIPALVFAAVLMMAAQIVIYIAFFAVLFTGGWPQGMRDFVVKVFRVVVRTNAYGMLLTDEYPPFTLD